MKTKYIFIIVVAITIVATNLIGGTLTSLIEAQTPTTSDLPMTTINETNSTVDVLNKTLPDENETDVVPVIPM